jgi:formate--tetrahydrofolate ligase
MAAPKSDIEIARAAKMRPIQDIGERLGIRAEHLIPYGHTKQRSASTTSGP